MFTRQLLTRIISIIFVFIWLQSQYLLFAGETHHEIAYKLASVHTHALNPDKALFNSDAAPNNETVSQFEWLMDSMRNRCVNSDQQIVTTLMSAWNLVRSRGYNISLLETLQALTTNALNKNLFGFQKVDFEKTSGYWTSHFKPEKKK